MARSDTIRRRAFCRAFWLAALAVGLTVCPIRTVAGEKPNILVILCDDLGYGDLGCFGHPVIESPHLDRLASQGLRLTSCYAAAPVCSPARAGLITGRTPNRAGVYDWIPDGSPMHLRQHELSVASIMKDAGYHTCHVGKWHLNGKFNHPEQPQPGDHGFEYWFSTQNNALLTHANPVNFARNGKAVGPLQGFSSTLIVDEAIRWLDERDSARPFCLFVWFHSPHEVIATAEAYVERYLNRSAGRKQAEYFGNVTQMDEEVGRLLGAVDTAETGDNTFVFFTSDNGPETLNRYGPNSSRSYGVPGPLRGMKLHMYEGGIRVPGIVRWPGHARPGSTSDEPISGVDVLPTLCEIAGADLPARPRLDGASFLPALSGKSVDRSVPLYWQYDRALSHPKVALRDGDWKLLADAELKTFELYNLRDDVAEAKNLAKQEPKRTQRLAEKLRKLHADVKRDGPTWPKWSRKKKKAK